MQPKWLANQLKNVADESMICQRIFRELADELISFRQKTDDTQEHASAMLNQCFDKLFAVKQYLKAEREQNRKRFVDAESQSSKSQQALDYNTELNSNIANKKSYWAGELASTNNNISETSQRLAHAQNELSRLEQEIFNCNAEVDRAASALNQCESSVRYETVTRNGYTERVKIIPDCSSQRSDYHNAQSKLSSARSLCNDCHIKVNNLKEYLSKLYSYQQQCQNKISRCNEASSLAVESHKKLIQQQKLLNQKKANLLSIEEYFDKVSTMLKIIEDHHNEQIKAKEISESIQDELITQERIVTNFADNTEAELFIFERRLLEKNKQLLEFDRRLFS